MHVNIVCYFDWSHLTISAYKSPLVKKNAHVLMFIPVKKKDHLIYHMTLLSSTCRMYPRLCYVLLDEMSMLLEAWTFVNEAYIGMFQYLHLTILICTYNIIHVYTHMDRAWVRKFSYKLNINHNKKNGPYKLTRPHPDPVQVAHMIIDIDTHPWATLLEPSYVVNTSDDTQTSTDGFIQVQIHKALVHIYISRSAS